MPGHGQRSYAASTGEGAESAAQPTLLEWAMLVLDSVRRRWAVVAAVVVAVMVATGAYYFTKTPIYRVEAKILAQRPQALPTVVRAMGDDVPSRTAWEMIHRHDNLVALVKETNLVADPGPQHRGGVRALLDRLKRQGAAEPADPLELVVLALDRHLAVLTDEGTITVQMDWPDPLQAYAVVQAALRNFLEARHLQEVTAIDEVISVLQGRASVLRTQLDEATEAARARPVRAPRVPVAVVRQPSEELVRMQSVIDAKKRAFRDVEEFRLRRLADVQAQLDQARNTLSAAHPTVISLAKDIEALSRETPQAQALRDEEHKLTREYNERLAREGLSPHMVAPVTAPAFEAEPRVEDERVRDLRLQYEQIRGRISGALVDLDAARAAFKYRYNVVWPPQVPREPVSPRFSKVFGLGAIAALALALAAAVAPDLWSGRIVQRWQVERSLGVQVLGEIRRRP